MVSFLAAPIVNDAVHVVYRILRPYHSENRLSAYAGWQCYFARPEPVDCFTQIVIIRDITLSQKSGKYD